MTPPSPTQARARVQLPCWQRLYEAAFATFEDDLAHVRVELLAAQHQGTAGQMEMISRGWRDRLEHALDTNADAATGLVELLDAELAAPLTPAEVLRAGLLLPGARHRDRPFWTPSNAESVLVDIGAGVTANRIAAHAAVRRRTVTALAWWRCAESAHHPQAAFDLGVHARSVNALERAARYWTHAAAHGHEQAGQLVAALSCAVPDVLQLVLPGAVAH